jgi:homoserine kinase
MNDFHIRLPATTANLGSGFDAVALALELFLDIRAVPAESYSIDAIGRNAVTCSKLQRNLMLAVYEGTLKSAGKNPMALAIKVDNGIPVGMGCGSSAAARLAGIAMANHFGQLRMTEHQIVREACRLEGHPDNATACWLGGFTVAAGSGDELRWNRINPPLDWTAILILPDEPLATTAARAILPDMYSRSDAVTNVQNVALLTSAFYTGRSDLLCQGMHDRLHHPYRARVSTLLPVLLPLAGQAGIFGVALSGAGPSVLALSDTSHLNGAVRLIRKAVESLTVEILPVRLLSTNDPLPGITEV